MNRFYVPFKIVGFGSVVSLIAGVVAVPIWFGYNYYFPCAEHTAYRTSFIPLNENGSSGIYQYSVLSSLESPSDICIHTKLSRYHNIRIKKSYHNSHIMSMLLFAYFSASLIILPVTLVSNCILGVLLFF